MIRRAAFRLLISLLLGLPLVIGAPVSAHQLSQDGTVSGVLHFEPHDQVVSGQPVEYLVYFSDKAQQFGLGGCDCQLRVSEQGKTLITHDLTQDMVSATIAQGLINFPSPDLYSLQIVGKPIAAGTFQPFVLTYSVTAVPPAKTPGRQVPWGIWIIPGVLLAGGLWWAYNRAQTLDEQALDPTPRRPAKRK